MLVTDARICPKCGSKHTHVQESRINDADGYLIRYRECNRCKARYRTYEIRDAEWKKLNRLRDDFSDFTRKMRERLDMD